MKDLLLSIITIIILSGTLAFVSFFLWIKVKHKYLLYWTVGWSLYFIHFIFSLAAETRPSDFLFNCIGDTLTAFSVVFLLFGVFELAHLSLSKYNWLWILPIMNSVWSFYWNILHNSQIANIPTSFSFGFIQVLMGIILLKHKKTNKYASNWALGFSMLLWGLHKFDRPVLRYIPHLAPYGFLIGSVFAFTTAVSMLILMVEQTSQERDISTERFHTLFKYINDIIYFLRLDGRIIEVNQAAIDKYRYSKEELLNMTIFQIQSDDGKKVIEAQMKEADEKGLAFETIHFCKNGIPFQVEVHSVGATIGGQRILLNTVRDISERKRAEAALKKMSHTDGLTGLYNRRFLEENLTRFDQKENLPICVIIGDMNGLKFVNDAFGHKTGDDLLKETARIIKESCDQNDLVLRWGGDEFMIFLLNTDAKSAEDLCQIIKRKCEASNFIPIQPSIALGYAIKDVPSRNIQEIFKIADDRMYRNKLLENKSSRNAIISSLQNTLFERSYETEQHAERLKILASKMGYIIKLPTNQLDDLALLATLHDVGKMAIPEEILSKPGKLSAEEWIVMKKHPNIGHRIIQAIPDLTHIAEAILAHHERWDGTGYPQGLKHEEIPLISRIISIVDSYDAMTHKRIYQEAISHEQAIAEISHCAGSQFDPGLVKVFLTLFENQD